MVLSCLVLLWAMFLQFRCKVFAAWSAALLLLQFKQWLLRAELAGTEPGQLLQRERAARILPGADRSGCVFAPWEPMYHSFWAVFVAVHACCS